MYIKEQEHKMFICYNVTITVYHHLHLSYSLRNAIKRGLVGYWFEEMVFMKEGNIETSDEWS